MVGDKRADGAIVMGNSIRMVMKCKSQDRERKANEQEVGKFSIHHPNNLSISGEKSMGCTLYFTA
jgi:hypothetical protein